MKKILFSLLTVMGLASTSTAQTPLPVLTAESGNASVETANCWAFGSASYVNTAGQVITGTFSIRSNSPSNLSPTACWIKTPWIKPGTGNITLKYRNQSSTAGTIRRIILSYVSYDPNSLSGSKEANFTRFDSVSYSSPFPTTNQNLSFPIPAAIANANAPYKIYISLVGSGGNSNSRLIVDDISIPGTYFADPANNCLPQTQVADKDGDGVADNDDAYPEDKDRAYDVQLPDATESTLMFEDLWPATGDYDFNDFVASYNAIAVTNADNKVVEVKVTTNVLAIGASYNNSFAVQFDGLNANKITGVKGNITSNSKFFSFNENGTEAGQDNANVIIFDQARALFPGVGGSGINVNPEGPFVNAEKVTVTISFNTSKETAIEVKELKLNPYIIVNQNRDIEVHLPDYAPSNLANKKFFGTEKDNSNFEKGIYYKSANNLPFAIKVEGLVPHMIEKQDILTGYPKLADWAISEGKEYQNWYNASEGFRENKLLIYLEGVK
jgi:LruC domain-containing protein